MRYYYYGKEPDIRENSRWTGEQDGDGRNGAGGYPYERLQIVYDEDTIYEIDEECEECRRKGISPALCRSSSLK